MIMDYIIYSTIIISIAVMCCAMLFWDDDYRTRKEHK